MISILSWTIIFFLLIVIQNYVKHLREHKPRELVTRLFFFFVFLTVTSDTVSNHYFSQAIFKVVSIEQKIFKYKFIIFKYAKNLHKGNYSFFHENIFVPLRFYNCLHVFIVEKSIFSHAVVICSIH